MALQIANPSVVRKIESLARQTGLNKTAAVEAAVDRLLRETAHPIPDDRMSALLAQIDRIPDLPNAVDPLVWDELGLPK